jgi:phage/plasmid-like protein (TIGR03299 family)
MAHQIDESLGRPAIAYVGDTPWHRLGQVMPQDADLDEWRIAAGMDWEALEQPVYTAPATGEADPDANPYAGLVPVPGKKCLVRSDTNAPLSIVSARYKVLQPRDVIEFYRELVDQNGFAMETAGVIMGGRRVWALANIGDAFTLFGRDRVDGYVLMTTSYDGSFATQAMFTSVRVVCNNTLEAAGVMRNGESANSFRVPHCIEFNPEHAKGKLGLDRRAWENYEANVRELAHRLVSPTEAMEFFTRIAGLEKHIERNADNGQVVKFPEPTRTVKKLVESYQQAPGADLPGSRSTAWGLVNAVTHYVDHVMPAGNDDKRFISATWGTARNRKQHAWKLVQDLIAA